MPALLAAQPALGSAPKDALHAALVAANAELHASAIDDSLSGTTACCALLVGDILYVANVGDSRAVIAERPEADSEALTPSSSGGASAGGASGSGAGSGAQQRQRLEARDLSLDQTPFRADECLRVLQAGARVMTLDQLEGLKDPGLPCWTNEDDCDGDPPRLWHPTGMFPGTAFTRSLGDSGARGAGLGWGPGPAERPGGARACSCLPPARLSWPARPLPTLPDGSFATHPHRPPAQPPRASA